MLKEFFKILLASFLAIEILALLSIMVTNKNYKQKKD